MPPALLANRCSKETGDNFEINKNTTKKEFFNGLRMK